MTNHYKLYCYKTCSFLTKKKTFVFSVSLRKQLTKLLQLLNHCVTQSYKLLTK